MPRRRVFNFHDDPHHGWLEVKFTTLRNHGIKPDWFTPWSYVDADKGVVYLEQDHDAYKLLRWYDERGYKWAMRENIYQRPAPIRNLLRLDPLWPSWPDVWLPMSQEYRQRVDDYEKQYGDVDYEVRRMTMPLRKKMWKLRRERGLPERQMRDLKNRKYDDPTPMD